MWIVLMDNLSGIESIYFFNIWVFIFFLSYIFLMEFLPLSEMTESLSIVRESSNFKTN